MPGLYLTHCDAELRELLHAYDLPVAGVSDVPCSTPGVLSPGAFLRQASVAALLGQPIAAEALRERLSMGDPLAANVLRRHVMLRLSLLPYLRPGREVTAVEGGFLVGGELLILPVSADDTVDAPLLPGVWTELNGTIHTGRIRCMRGYNETPLLARENTLLPISMNGGSPAQKAASDADRLTLHWFQLAGEAECVLADGTRYHVQRAGEHISVRTDALQPFHLILHQDGAETLIK